MSSRAPAPAHSQHTRRRRRRRRRRDSSSRPAEASCPAWSGICANSAQERIKRRRQRDDHRAGDDRRHNPRDGALLPLRSLYRAMEGRGRGSPGPTRCARALDPCGRFCGPTQPLPRTARAAEARPPHARLGRYGHAGHAASRREPSSADGAPSLAQAAAKVKAIDRAKSLKARGAVNVTKGMASVAARGAQSLAAKVGEAPVISHVARVRVPPDHPPRPRPSSIPGTVAARQQVVARQQPTRKKAFAQTPLSKTLNTTPGILCKLQSVSVAARLEFGRIV